MKKNNQNISDINYIGFYLFPFLSSVNIWILLDGKLKTASGYSMEGFEARAVAVFILLFVIIDLYHTFIQVPKNIKGKNCVRDIILLIVKSGFFYCWLLLVINVFIFIITKLNYLLIAYLIILIVCFFLQKKLVDRINNLISSPGAGR